MVRLVGGTQSSHLATTHSHGYKTRVSTHSWPLYLIREGFLCVLNTVGGLHLVLGFHATVGSEVWPKTIIKRVNVFTLITSHLQ